MFEQPAASPSGWTTTMVDDELLDGKKMNSSPHATTSVPLSPSPPSYHKVPPGTSRPAIYRKDSETSFATTDSGVYSATYVSSLSAGSVRSRADSCRTLTEDDIRQTLDDDDCHTDDENDEALRRYLLDFSLSHHHPLATLPAEVTPHSMRSPYGGVYLPSSDDEDDDDDDDDQLFYDDQQHDEEEDPNEYCRRWAEGHSFGYKRQRPITITADDEVHDDGGNGDERSRTPPPTASYRNDTRLARCQSLRSALKSGTPRRKKMVRFADAMGLDLEHIRHLYEEYNDDCCDDDDEDEMRSNAKLRRSTVSMVEPPHSSPKRLITRFVLPSMTSVRRLVQTNKLCLDSFTVADMCATGYVKVANLDFTKEVYARYSLDNWVTWSEARAVYMPGSSDGNVDKFAFTIFLPTDLPLFSVCRFAIRYRVRGADHWDNNGGNNYSFECVAGTGPSFVSKCMAAPRMPDSPQSSSTGLFHDHGWLHFF